jgi:VWFA-related protein
MNLQSRISNLESRIKHRNLLLLLYLCLMTGMLNVAAQDAGSFKMRVEVDLVTVEVTALDRNRNPVRNLKKEDFRLYEDGKKQEIASFEEVNSESAVSSLGASPIGESTQHGKTVLILFIDSSFDLPDIQKSRDSAERYVREHMRPQDLFAVGSFNSSMRILQNFTHDPEDVLAAIKQPPSQEQGYRFYDFNLLLSLEKLDYSIGRIKGPKTVLLYTRWHYFYASDFSPEYRKALDSARKSNVVFYTVGPPRQAENYPTVSVEKAATSAPGLGTPTQSMAQDVAMVAMRIPMRSLADESGGSRIEAWHLESELGKLDQQISNYYILGFQSGNPRHDGAFRKLEVKTGLKGVTLKHRPGYQDRRPVDALASSRQEKTLLTALASPGKTSQLPIDFRPAYFYDSPRAARVLIAAKIRMEKTSMQNKGDQLGTDLSIMGVAYAEDGSVAARFSQTLPIAFDKEKETEFRKEDFAYRNYLKLRPGKYHLKFAVSDESNHLGSVEQPLEVPPFPERGLAASSLVLVGRSSPLPELIRNLQTQLLDESDPLTYSDMQIEPSLENRAPAGSAVPVLFRIYNLPGGSGPWELSARAKLVDGKGREFGLAPISLNKSMSVAGRSEAVVSLSLPFQGVPPGKYRLVVEVTEAASSESATLQTDLELI